MLENFLAYSHIKDLNDKDCILKRICQKWKMLENFLAYSHIKDLQKMANMAKY